MSFLDPPVRVDVRGDRYGLKTTAALRPFRAALAGRDSASCNIVVLGDSTEEGTGAGTLGTDRYKAWPNQLAYLLRNRFPTSGETNLHVPNYVPVFTPSSMATGWTTTGTWVASDHNGPSARAATSVVNGSTATYVVPVGVTSADILYVQGSAITGLTVAVDGGSASATFGNTTPSKDGATHRITFADTTITHSVVVTTVGVNNILDGILMYSGNETVGTRVFDGGHHGSYVSAYPKIATYGWLPLTASASTLSGAQSLIPLNPDLLILGWQFNDYAVGASGESPTTYAANLTSMITFLRALLPSKTIPILLLGKYTPATTSATSATWQQFMAAQKGVAAADSYACHLDLTSVMPAVGSTEATALSLYGDTVHATAKGYQMVADAVASFIAP